ncbi:unnamed protein product, partial [Onchocerca ochengi]|uniref:Uncharacterized protein n=1 Tax=Onchocerca ochengi TaxID=42157 RepID=A0A182EE97_ONCOC
MRRVRHEVRASRNTVRKSVDATRTEKYDAHIGKCNAFIGWCVAYMSDAMRISGECEAYIEEYLMVVTGNKEMSETNRNAHSIEYISYSPTPRTFRMRNSLHRSTPRFSRRWNNPCNSIPDASRARNILRSPVLGISGREGNSSYSSISEISRIGSDSCSPTPGTSRRGNSPIPGNLEQWNDMQMLYSKAERTKERMMEYREILQCIKNLRTAENEKNRSKNRMLKQKCEKYKQQIAEEKSLRDTLQECFFELENQFNNSAEQLTELQVENEQKRSETVHLQKILNQTWEILIQVRKQDTKKDRIWNLRTKNALHAKRVAEEKLREALEKCAMETKRSAELEESEKMLKTLIEKMKLEMEEKERSCNDSKIRLAVHSEAASSSCRQVIEANKKIAELAYKNKRLFLQLKNIRSELHNFLQDFVNIKAGISQIKSKNKKHDERLQQMDQRFKTEMLPLIQSDQQKNALLAQHSNRISSLLYENMKVKKVVEELHDQSKNMAEIIHNSEAVLHSQHQELGVYEINERIREREIGKLQRQSVITTNQTNLLKAETGKFQQFTYPIYNFAEIRYQIACLLNNIDRRGVILYCISICFDFLV